MEKNFGKISVDNSAYINYDFIVVDGSEARIVFASMVASDSLCKVVGGLLDKSKSSYIEGRGSYNFKGDYEVFKERPQGKDFTHMIVKSKDSKEKVEDVENYTFYIMYRTEEELMDVLFDKIYDNTSIPILKEWINYIYNALDRINGRCVRSLPVYHFEETKPFSLNKIQFTKNMLLEIVQNGLRSGSLSLGNTTESSQIMQEVTGLDMYLNVFGDILAEKIQRAFVPKFDPKAPVYTDYVHNYDDACYHAGINIYEAQKSVIQSVVNNMNKNKSTFIIGEMGVGKTLLGLGSIYSHYQRKAGSTNVIMCPTHIVPKWKDEVERLVPNGKGYIVDNIDELMEIEDKMADKNKKEHMFIILSKESAKFSYEKRPAANWSISKKTFTCPDCGRPLKKEVFHGEGRQRYKTLENFEEEDFLKEYAHNQTCINKVKVLNKETNKFEEVDCGAKLWGPLNKFESNCKWVKLGKHGWIYRSHFEKMYQDYYSRREHLNKKEQEFLLKLMEKKEELEETGQLKSSSNGVRKYSIARYIKEKHCGNIDYFIADELNMWLLA